MTYADEQRAKWLDKQIQSPYWEARLADWDVDQRVKRAIVSLYECYPKDCMPQGICDPGFIMNRLAKELGIGDGQGTFWLPE